MSQSDLAIADFYDHAQVAVDRAPDWGGDDLFAARRPAPRPAPLAPKPRRTVAITGRPDAPARPRRPARTIEQRFAHRPERIASWTCALGALSILLAIVTGQ